MAVRVDPTKSDRYVRFDRWMILFMTRKSSAGESHRWHGYEHCKRRLTISTIRTGGGIEIALIQYRRPKQTSREKRKSITLEHILIIY